MYYINIKVNTVFMWVIDLIFVIIYTIFIIGVYIFIFERDIIKDVLNRLQSLKKR